VNMGWIQEIIGTLGDQPEESWQAMESLAGIDPAVRNTIIMELAAHRSNPGVQVLLHLISTARDPGIRAAGCRALTQGAWPCSTGNAGLPPEPAGSQRRHLGGAFGSSTIPVARGASPDRDLLASRSLYTHRRSLVTPVDGRGCGLIGVSTSHAGQCR